MVESRDLESDLSSMLLHPCNADLFKWIPSWDNGVTPERLLPVHSLAQLYGSQNWKNCFFLKNCTWLITSLGRVSKKTDKVGSEQFG